MSKEPPPGGVKRDAGKPDWSLFPLKAMEGTIRVMEFGAAKYARFGWQHVEPHRYYAALMRHLADYVDGLEADAETGMHNLWHAGCCMVFLLWHLRRRPFTSQDIRDAIARDADEKP